MEEIKFTVEKFFDEDHEIVDDFIDAVKNGDVKNVYYYVDNVKKLKKGDVNFDFEMKGHKYVMDPEMSPYYALEIIELFKKIAFRFKNGHCLGLENQFHCFGYDVKNVIGVEDNIVCPKKYYDESGEYDYTNVTDDDVMNTFVFTWYDDYSPSKQKSDDEINEIIKKNGGVRFYVDYKDYDFEGHIKKLNRHTQYELNNLVEEQLEAIRYIVTATYFKEEKINEEK